MFESAHFSTGCNCPLPDPSPYLLTHIMHAISYTGIRASFFCNANVC